MTLDEYELITSDIDHKIGELEEAREKATRERRLTLFPHKRGDKIKIKIKRKHPGNDRSWSKMPALLRGEIHDVEVSGWDIELNGAGSIVHFSMNVDAFHYRTGTDKIEIIK